MIFTSAVALAFALTVTIAGVTGAAIYGVEEGVKKGAVAVWHIIHKPRTQAPAPTPIKEDK